MARNFGATTHRLLSLYAFLSSNAGPFTVSWWMKPTNLSQSSCALIQANTSGTFQHGFRWEGVSDSIDFAAAGYSGTNPGTSSALALDATDVADGCWVGYRYNGAAGEWSKWKNGTKSVISASITFTLASCSPELYFGRNVGMGTNSALCDLAEFAVWHAGLSDDEMAELARGIAADQIARGALQFYMPMRGTLSPERNWVDAAGSTAATVTGATAATHPEIIARTVQPVYQPSWVLDLFHADGTIKLASRDLYEEIDVDILGDFYPGDIRNPDSIEVRDELSDGFYGVQVPQSAVILVKPGPAYRDIVMEDGPVAYWRLSETSGTVATDETTNNLDGTYTGGFTLDQRGGVKAFDADGRAVRFNGTSGFVSVGDNALLDVVAALTLEAWVYLDNRTNYYFIVTKNTTSSTPQAFEWRIEQTTGKPQFLHGGATSTATNAVPLLGWHHIAVTRAGASGTTVTHYLDGIPNGSGTLGGTIAASAQELRIGSRDDDFTFIPGALCHVALFDSALSADRMALRYRVGLQAWKGMIGHVREWRGCPARLRRYDRKTHELTDEMHGVVQDVDFAGTSITIGTDDSVLDTPIPRQVLNTNDQPSASDLGCPVPVIAGSSVYLAPPACGHDDEPEGKDYMLGHQHDADGGLMPVKVENLWEDIQGDAGLERLTEWESLATLSGATVAYVSATVFSVNKDVKYLLPVGLPVRYKDTAGGSVWQYSYVTAYDTAPAPDQVTIADAEMDSGLNNLEIQSGNTYLVEKSRYSLLAQNLVSVRRFDGAAGSPVVQASNTALANPATLVDEILRHPSWGLGLTTNAASVAAAEAVCSAAGIAAVSGALGWNKQQRRARDVIRDLLSMRGGRLSTNASTGEWHVEFDSAPAAALYTLGFGDSQWNNVTSVRSIRRRSLAEAVQSVRFRFGLRSTASTADGLAGSISLIPEMYRFYVDADCLEVGKSIQSTNPYVRAVSAARRIAYYQAQNLKHSDISIELEGGQEMRFLQPGDLVRYTDPIHGLDQTYRVWRTAKRLSGCSVLLRGYDASIYTFDDTLVSDITALDANGHPEIDIDESSNSPGAGTNLLYNPDFSAGFVVQTNIGVAEAMPGWSSVYNATDLTSLATTADADTISNASYLTAVVAANSTLSPYLEARVVPIGSGDEGRQMIASVYADRADGWRFGFFFDPGGAAYGTDVGEPMTRVAGGASPRNANGWRRYFAVTQVPTGATALHLWILMDRATGTYNFDGAQLEFASRRSNRPTEWKRHPRFGVDPAQLQAGTVTFRPSGQPEAGLKIVNVIEDVSTFGVGTTKDSSAALFPAGCMPIFLAGRVTTAIAGGLASIAVGIAADTQRFAPNGTSKALNTTWNVSNHNGSHVPLQVYATNTAVRISAIGGNFSGAGVARLHACYAVSVAPTN